MGPAKEARTPRVTRFPLRIVGKRGRVADEGLTLVGGTDTTGFEDQLPHLPHAVEDVVQAEGAAQGGIVPLSGSVTAWLFRDDIDPLPVPLTDLPSLVEDDANFVWIDLSSYAESNLREVGQLLSLHRSALHAVLSPWHRPMLVTYRDNFLASTTIARLDGDARRVQATELDLIVGRNFLVSAHKLPLPFAEQALARARHNPELVQLDAAYMLYILLDELLAYYEDVNRHVQGEIERLEEQALHDTTEAFLENLLHFKRYVFALSQLEDQHREVFAAFLRPDFHWVFGNEVEMYFRDLQTRLTRLLDTLLDARDAVNGAFDIYVSHMSHRTNQVIKLLTLVSTVLLPATVIIGLFGASLSNSLSTTFAHTPAGFLTMVLAIVLVSGGILVGFHRRGWV